MKRRLLCLSLLLVILLGCSKTKESVPEVETVTTAEDFCEYALAHGVEQERVLTYMDAREEKLDAYERTHGKRPTLKEEFLFRPARSAITTNEGNLSVYVGVLRSVIVDDKGEEEVFLTSFALPYVRERDFHILGMNQTVKETPEGLAVSGIVQFLIKDTRLEKDFDITDTGREGGKASPKSYNATF